jgi:hypothetical protein
LKRKNEQEIHSWTFESYLLVVSFAISFFLLSTLLFPDDISEYQGYEDYFGSHQRWFFGLLAISFIIDMFDGLIKGSAYVASLGPEFPIRNVVSVFLCIIAMFVKNKKFQLGFVICTLFYELSWILRLYGTVQ